VKLTNYEAPHYAVFSNLPPLPPSKNIPLLLLTIGGDEIPNFV